MKNKNFVLMMVAEDADENSVWLMSAKDKDDAFVKYVKETFENEIIDIIEDGFEDPIDSLDMISSIVSDYPVQIGQVSDKPFTLDGTAVDFTSFDGSDVDRLANEILAE